MTLKHNDMDSILDTIWEALEGYRENCIPEGQAEYDDQWSDICTAMAWIQEDLNQQEEIDS
jgi:hypothetical protein